MTSQTTNTKLTQRLNTLTRYSPNSAKRRSILERQADRLLAKSGYFPHDPGQSIDQLVDADAIGSHGTLRPTWVGRA